MLKSLQFRVDKWRCRQVVAAHTERGLPKVYHYHVMKTGGTSMNQAFMQLAGDQDEVYQSIIQHPELLYYNKDFVITWGKWEIESGLFTYAFSHMPKWQINVPEDVFTFTCLRDPFSRLKSRYNQLKWTANSQFRGMMEEKFPRHAEWVEDDFLGFVEQMEAQQRTHQLYLFSEDYDPKAAFESASQVDYFYFLENVNEGFTFLENVSQLP
ncbi:MAG: sulfotransferase family 2 domain-containing protein, partial [Bacteroidota bacterium]